MRVEKLASNVKTQGKARAPFGAKLADEARFIKAWLENPSITGAVSPSGRQLARYMAMQVDASLPGMVVELGPGTGPVTQALVNRGIAEERLILVEYDKDFCELLAARYPKATIVRGDAYNLAKTLAGFLHAPVCAVVSSLPLLLRDEPQRLALLGDAFAMMHPSAPYIQFTYGLKSPIPRFADAGEHGFESRRSLPIWLNLPPAHVWTYRQHAHGAGASLPRPALMADLGARTRRMGGSIRLATLNARAKIAIRVAKARRVAEQMGK